MTSRPRAQFRTAATMSARVAWQEGGGAILDGLTTADSSCADNSNTRVGSSSRTTAAAT
jgi:hypothetical protein